MKDDIVALLKKRIREFKKNHPELYETESNDGNKNGHKKDTRESRSRQTSEALQKRRDNWRSQVSKTQDK